MKCFGQSMLQWLVAAGLLAGVHVRGSVPMGSDDLFNLTNIWTIHLTFTPEQWNALEPKHSDVERRGFGGGGPRLLGPEGGRNGLSAARGIEFEYAHANLEFSGMRFTNIAVRYKGNGTYMRSRNSLKHSLKLDLNKFVPGQKLAGVSKLNLHNNVTDASWMNEPLSYRLYRDAGVPAPRTSYARVFVTVPGEHARAYFGLYSLVENIDGNFAERNFETKKGAIFKPVTRELFGHLGDDWAKYNQIYDPKTELTAQQSRRVIDFAALATSASDEEFAARVGEFLDLDEFARFMAVTVYLSTLDSILGMGQNFVVYLHPRSNQFQFIPWDLDNSFGQFPSTGTQEDRDQLSLSHPWQGENRFIERVFKVEAFQKTYRARLEEFSGTVFKPARFTNQVNAVAAAIRSAVKEEPDERLSLFDKAVAGENITRPGRSGNGRGERLGGRGSSEVKSIKAFVAARSQSVADQLAGKSEGKIIVRGRGGPGGPGEPLGPFDGPRWFDRFEREIPSPGGAGSLPR
jgi:spore coat protein H